LERVSPQQLKKPQHEQSHSRLLVRLLRRAHGVCLLGIFRSQLSTDPTPKALSFSRSRIIRGGQSTGSRACKTANKLYMEWPTSPLVAATIAVEVSRPTPGIDKSVVQGKD
jgi:hypothetical protein